MKLNQQQQDVLKWVREGSGSLNLVARAGCGKTTTLIAVVHEIIAQLPGKNIFLGAFNKAIATEIAERLKAAKVDWRTAESSTLHSIGFRQWRGVARGVKVENKKVLNLVYDAADNSDNEHRYACHHIPTAIINAVSLAKQSGFGWLFPVDDEHAWVELFEHHDIDLDDAVSLKAAVAASVAILKASQAQDYEVIDFDDMICAPLVHRVPVKYPYDFVLIDEAQDTNAARRSLALSIMRPKTGRLIAVGDDRQAIYGFTGADSNAMDLIKRELNSQVLPLNVTYRCPKSIVRAAQRYVPDITAHESAPQGVVREETYTPHFKFEQTDAVLCRNTAPLIELAYRLIGNKVPCRVEGRDIGKSLEVLARRWKARDLNSLRNRLAEYAEKETTKWLAKGREEKAAAVDDKVSSLMALIQACEKEDKHTVNDLVDLINSMFGDSTNGTGTKCLTLSTVHKAKGREWPRVFILKGHELMPSRWARKDWQLAQEENLIYVAITRAQSELVWLN